MTNDMFDLPLLLTIRETAKLLRCAESTARRRIGKGEIESIKSGGRVLVYRDKLLSRLGLLGDNSQVRRRRSRARAEHEMWSCMRRLGQLRPAQRRDDYAERSVDRCLAMLDQKEESC